MQIAIVNRFQWGSLIFVKKHGGDIVTAFYNLKNELLISARMEFKWFILALRNYEAKKD